MPKGDDKRVRNKIDEQGGLAQNHLNNLRNDMIVPQAQAAQNNYTNATQRSFEDYDKLSSGFGEFAKTGGYSPLDMSNIRARSVAPIRAIYANANRDIDRQRSLQGGYSPNYTAAKTRMARELSGQLGDANTNTEGMLAQMRNQGKQFGLSGGSSLFGTSPGLASHFGNMQNQTMNNWLQTQGLQQNLGLGLINAQQNAAQIPGAWQQGFDNAQNWVKTISGFIPMGGG